MFADSMEEKVGEIITPVLTQMGYEIVEISYKPVRRVDNLTIFIWKKGGISLNDCETVSKSIEPALDESDFTQGKNYVLNVSSPGLDRPIVSDKDFERNIGEEVEALLTSPVNKKHKFIGIIKSYNTDTFELSVGENVISLERSNVKSLKPYIRF